MATILSSPELEQVVDAGAALFASALNEAGASGAGVNVALCGGRSVVPFLAAALERRSAVSREIWRKARFFLVDERLVPDDHADSNFRLLREKFYLPLLKEDLIGESQCFSLDLGSGDPAKQVAAYEQKLGMHGGRFEIALLGIGEDAHVGALFPGHALLKEKRTGYATLFDSPKPPPQRMTATPALIRSASTLFGFMFGEGKRDALASWLDPAANFQSCPAKIVTEVPKGYIMTDLSLGIAK